MLSKTRAGQLAALWLTEHAGDDESNQSRADAVEACTAWLATQGVDFAGPLSPLVTGMIADGCLIGGVSAAAVTGGGEADWGGWQPGDEDAARRRAEDLGIAASLSGALAGAGTVAQELAAGYAKATARALLDGVAAGLAGAALGAAVYSALTDQAYAQRSVLGVIVTAVAAGALALYLNRKMQRVRWVTDPSSKVCPVCAANEAGSPYRTGSAPAWPAHPVCRCAVMPA